MDARRRKADVADHSIEVRALQRYVWGRLPLRKYLCGHTRVFDVVAVLIQEWPVGVIDMSQSGDTPEVYALEELVRSCKRHLALVYGNVEWDMWTSTLKHIIWQSMWLMLQWYRADPKNRSRMVRMRNKWRFHKRG